MLPAPQPSRFMSRTVRDCAALRSRGAAHLPGEARRQVSSPSSRARRASSGRAVAGQHLERPDTPQSAQECSGGIEESVVVGEAWRHRKAHLDSGPDLGQPQQDVQAQAVVRAGVLPVQRGTGLLPALIEALRADLADLLRLRLRSSRERFGNNRERPDALAAQIAEQVACAPVGYGATVHGVQARCDPPRQR